jgi:hypothetical protein
MLAATVYWRQRAPATWAFARLSQIARRQTGRCYKVAQQMNNHCCKPDDKTAFMHEKFDWREPAPEVRTLGN